ncbi:MAG: acetamidase/formamidase family protein, partial [Rhodospirillales bacterium]|nr:acetamidase/formamidase family protein [Rhodospirillales bacterium]
MPTHHLAATPETVRWGQFSAAFPPVLTVQSGDTVVIECVSGGRDVMPPAGSGLVVPPALAAIQERVAPGPGHIITGPVAIAGAQPGDMLEVR